MNTENFINIINDVMDKYEKYKANPKTDKIYYESLKLTLLAAKNDITAEEWGNLPQEMRDSFKYIIRKISEQANEDDKTNDENGGYNLFCSNGEYQRVEPYKVVEISERHPSNNEIYL